MNRYFIARANSDGEISVPPQGPYSSYDAALHELVKHAQTNPNPDIAGRRVLLDVSSVGVELGAELERLLLEDPLLSAVFNLGKHVGLAAK